jgi:UDP-GlcNAc:undecaprenyl-phosphate GlcNAc-1-phosphate transferase
MRFAFTLILAVVSSMALIPLLMRAAGPMGMLDAPGERKVHTGAIPRVGGISIVLGAVLPVLMWVPLRVDIRAYLIGGLVLFLFGLWDDSRDVGYGWKFLGQFIAASVVVLYGDVVLTSVPFVLDQTLAGAIGIPLSILFLVGITNAINLSDGLDGLAGGTTLLAIGAMGVLAFEAGDWDLALLCTAISGAILGFLRYNSYPARVFMGDAGSQFLGFSAGVIALLLIEKASPALSPMVPVLILGLPILDTLAVMTQRLMEGHSPFKADKNHIHHKLMALGFDHYEAVLIIYVATAGLISIAYGLRYEWDALLAGIYLSFCVGVLGLFTMALRRGWQLHHRPRESFLLQRAVGFLRRTQGLGVAAWYFAKLAVPLIFLSAAVAGSDIPRDIAVAAGVMFAAMAASILWRPQGYSVLERLAVYVTAAFVAYLLTSSPGLLAGYGAYENALFVMLGLAVAVWVRFVEGDTFRVSPMDFLVIFIVLLVPNLKGLALFTPVVAATAIKLIILFYACEMQLSQQARRLNPVRYGALLTLAVLGVRGFWG